MITVAITLVFLLLALGIALVLPPTEETDTADMMDMYYDDADAVERITEVSTDDVRSFIGVDFMYDFTPATMLAALSKNIGMHLGGGGRAHNQRVVARVEAVHNALDVPLNTYRDGRPLPEHLHYRVGQHRDEDLAINPWHFRIFLLCLVLLFLWYYLYRPYVSGIAVCLVIGFLLFGMWFDWTPYSTRRHLPLFVAGCAIIALVLDRCDRRTLVLGVVVTALAALSAPFVLYNEMRPLVGKDAIFRTPRHEMYFVKYPELYFPAQVLAAFLAETRAPYMGIYARSQATEYPFLVSLQKYSPYTKIHHIAVDNGTQIFERDVENRPALIFAIGFEEVEFLYRGEPLYQRIWRYPGMSLYAGKDYMTQFAAARGIEEEDAPDTLAAMIDGLMRKIDGQLLVNGRFLEGLDGWRPWGDAQAYSNGVRVVNEAYIRIENPTRAMVGIAQEVPVTSGTVYRLSGRARSTGRTTSEIIFGGRIGVYIPGQREVEVVWPTEYIYWSDRSTVFTNMVDGMARVFVHMGYGNVGSTGEFTNIRFEEVGGEARE